jgi:hypothetical protein
MLARQAGQYRVQARVRQPPPDHRAALGRLSRPRPVERQDQLIRQPGQRLLPVLDLPGQHPAVRRVPAGTASAAEQVPLP